METKLDQALAQRVQKYKLELQAWRYNNELLCKASTIWDGPYPYDLYVQNEKRSAWLRTEASALFELGVNVYT